MVKLDGSDSVSGGGIIRSHRCRLATESSSILVVNGLSDGAHGLAYLDILYVIRCKKDTASEPA